MSGARSRPPSRWLPDEESRLGRDHAQARHHRHRSAEDPRRAAALAVGVDHPPRQSRPRQRRRAEGRRAPGELRLDDRDHGRALFPRARPERPGRGQAARRAGAPRDPLSARHAERARRSRISAASAARKAIRAGPRTRSRSTSRPARSASASRSRSSPAWCRIISPRTAGWTRPDRGRFVALIGDAELDEGNIYEAIIEGAKHDVRNLWWIVDYNRQSLDATSADRMFERFDEIFRSCGWRVVELRYGKRLQAALDEQSGAQGVVRAAAQRRAVGASLPGRRGVADAHRGATSARTAAAFLKEHDDAALAALFTDLGGHCMETLVEAFDAAQDDVPTLFIAWTIKGYGLPFAGHKDNHAGLMNPTQMAALRDAMGVREGQEWEPLEGVGDNARPGVEALIERSRIAREKRARSFGTRRRSRHPRARRRRAIDPGRVRPHPARPVEGRRRACRPHRHHLARRHRLDQPRRLGQPARPVPPRAKCADVFAQGKDCVGAKMVRQQQRPAYRARHRREQSVPDARRRRPVGRPVRRAAVPDRNALRPVHRPRPR